MSYDLLINDLEYALTALRVYGTYSGLRHLRNAGVPIEVALLAHAGRFPQAVY